MDTKLKIAVIEDEPIINLFVQGVVTSLGHRVTFSSDNAEEAMAAFRQHTPDMAFIDINLSGVRDGIWLARELALLPHSTAVIFITAYSDDTTVQEAAMALPHSYLVKPFTETDISIALTLASRHQTRPITEVQTSIRIDEEYIYDLHSSTLSKNGQVIDLTANESALIAYLCKHISIVISYEQLKMAVWNGKEVSKTAVRDTIYRIRKKANNLPIETIASMGYRINKQ